MRILVLAGATPYMDPSPPISNPYDPTPATDPVFDPSLEGAPNGACPAPFSASLVSREAYAGKGAKPVSRRSRDLFQGSFRKILSAVRAARAAGLQVDLFIISPRYGVISEDAVVMPYRMSLTGRSKRSIRSLAGQLKTRERVEALLRSPYDLCVVIANKNDLLLVHDPAEGFDLAKLCKRITAISAPSTRSGFEGNEFIGIEKVGARAERLARLLDAMTSRSLNDY